MGAPLGDRPFLAQGATLAFASACGWLVNSFGVPAGWLSGAMIGAAALAILGFAHPFAPPVRWIAMTFSGVAIGSGLTPAMARSFAAYPASLALMMTGVAAATFLCAAALSRSPGWNRPTAFFSSVPGALSFVFAVAATVKGADLKQIAVVQISRVFLLMGLLPLAIAESGVHAVLISAPVDPWAYTLITLVFGFALGFGLERLNLAGGLLLGAMFVSGFAHLTGFAPGRPPLLLTIIAQVFIGAWVGARFIGLDWASFDRSLLAALGSFIVAISVSALFAGLASFFLDIPLAQTILAFAPGGLEAMTLLAFALGVDPLYVGAHHLARFFLISMSLPIAMRWWIGRGMKVDVAAQDEDSSIKPATDEQASH